MRKIKIAYIGGGSKQWARVFMTDLAIAPDFCLRSRLFAPGDHDRCRDERHGSHELCGVART